MVFREFKRKILSVPTSMDDCNVVVYDSNGDPWEIWGVSQSGDSKEVAITIY